MKQKRVGLVFRGKSFFLVAWKCNLWEIGEGLMFVRKKNAKILLFDLGKKCREPIHSIFVFFPFVAVWLDGKEVVEVKKIKPFLPFIRPKKQFDKLVEIPLNGKYSKELNFLVGKETFKN